MPNSDWYTMRSGRAKVVKYWEAVLKRLHICKGCKALQMIAELKGKGRTTPQKEKMLQRRAEDERRSISPEVVHDYDKILNGRGLSHWKSNNADYRTLLLAQVFLRMTGPERALVLKAMGGVEEGDAILGIGSEVNVDSHVYWWHDKYRPRKPKLINRVHTGYEWNKYNQPHHDHENPPPKMGQGYKFNFFYPDLVDNTKAPTYYIEKDGSGDTCPYEDIEFRIVNGEWEYSHRKAFKSTFERGFLHVYFNCKRYRYRR